MIGKTCVHTTSILAALALTAMVGCFHQPKISGDKLQCMNDDGCLPGWVCTKKANDTTQAFGTCVRSIALDGSVPDINSTDTSTAEASTPVDGQPGIDSATAVDGIIAALDGPSSIDASSDKPASTDLATDTISTPPIDGSSDRTVTPTPDTPATDSQSPDLPLPSPDGTNTDVPITSTGGVTGTGGGSGSGTGGVTATGGNNSSGGATGTGGLVGTGGSTLPPPIDCGPLDIPLNGSVNALTTTVGSQVDYSCNAGYGPSGSSTRYCLATGLWSGVAPTCVIANCPGLPSPTNGVVSAPTLTYGSNATYTCQPGYNLVGGDTRTCQPDGTWNRTAPTCPPVDCGALTDPTNGKVNLSTTTYPSSASYTCDPGYNLSSTTSRTCQTNGTWGGTTPSCTLVDCGAPAAPANGTVNKDKTTFGGTATYGCLTNFTLAGGQTRTCQADGTWSGSMPACTPTGCASGTHDGGNGTCVALYTCATGYHNGGTGKCVVNTTSCPTDQLTDNTGTCVPMAGVNWTQSTTPRNWNCVTISSDGSVLAGATADGFIYTSTDFGSSWNQRTSAHLGYLVASSADGKNLVTTWDYIYTSADSGVTWNQHATVQPWDAIVSSSDGSHLVAAVNPGYIFTSQDSGLTWNQHATVQTFGSLASSADGIRIIATTAPGQLYVSPDAGLTWNQVTTTQRNWYGVASSADGGKLVAVANAGYIYTSTNSGTTWNQTASVNLWNGVASSADGTKLVATSVNGYIFTSRDSGSNWTQRASPKSWLGTASSADGARIVAFTNTNDGTGMGYVYTSFGPIP